MDSDGTLAKVTYLPGVVSPAAVTEQQRDTEPKRVVPSDSAHFSDLAVFPKTLSAPTDRDSPDRTPLERNSAAPESSVPSERVLRRAENISLSALTRKVRSRWELEQLLLSRELEQSVVDAELDRLEKVGLIDDVALAENIVRIQHERKGLGRAAIVSEMRRKHIDPSVIDTAVEPLGADEEFARAVELAERRANQLRGLDHATAVRRLSGYLQRKGYSSDTVRRAVLDALPRGSASVQFS